MSDLIVVDKGGYLKTQGGYRSENRRLRSKSGRGDENSLDAHSRGYDQTAITKLGGSRNNRWYY